MVLVRRIAVSAGLCMLGAFLAGCMSERNQHVAPQATLASEGTGEVSYRAPEDGKVYVFDQNDNRVVYVGDVQKDQLVQVDPNKDDITVGDKIVFEKGLHKGNSHRIFFEDQNAQTARHRVTEERTESNSVH